MPLQDAIVKLIELARQTAAAAAMLKSRAGTPISVEECLEEEVDFQTALSRLPTLRPLRHHGPAMQWLGGKKTNAPHCEFIRLFVAALVNALKHAKGAIHQIDIDVFCSLKTLTISIRNEFDKDVDKKDVGGTKAVILMSVERLGGEKSKVRFEELPQEQGVPRRWLTQFTVPLNAYQRTKILWLRLG